MIACFDYQTEKNWNIQIREPKLGFNNYQITKF